LSPRSEHMAINEHLEHFAGLPVQDFEPETGIADPTGTVYRVGWTSYGEGDIGPKLAAYLNDPRAAEVTALVIGCWSYEGGNSAKVVADLVAGRDKLPNLRSLF